ncbi:hypothetical protein C8J57DRAFT_1255594 [Mycena rebaudengoi]|nr:hypothetical protein C8J57DRAFT_1255594 [Mycena rebaudengoi]
MTLTNCTGAAHQGSASLYQHKNDPAGVEAFPDDEDNGDVVMGAATAAPTTNPPTPTAAATPPTPAQLATAALPAPVSIFDDASRWSGALSSAPRSQQSSPSRSTGQFGPSVPAHGTYQGPHAQAPCALEPYIPGALRFGSIPPQPEYTHPASRSHAPLWTCATPHATAAVARYPPPSSPTTTDNESEYGGSEDNSDSETFARKEAQYLAKERFRQSSTIAEAKKLAPTTTRNPPNTLDAKRAGPFIIGPAPHYGYADRRTASDLATLTGRIDMAWLLATMGDSTPLSQRGNPRTKQRRIRDRPPGLPWNPTTPLRVTDEDVPMPQEPPPARPLPKARPFHVSYLGGAPLLDNPDTVFGGAPARGFYMGPTTDLNEVLDIVAQQPVTAWHQGTRNVDGVWPHLQHKVPRAADVLAARTDHFIAPERGAHGSIHRVTFLGMLWHGLSIPRLFERYVLRGQWCQPTELLPLEHFPFDFINGTMAQAFAWLFLHGIIPGSPELAAMQLFATSYRNAHEGQPDPAGQEFAEFSRNSRDVLSVPDDVIGSWVNLSFGAPCPDATTRIPQVPSCLTNTPVVDAPMPNAAATPALATPAPTAPAVAPTPAVIAAPTGSSATSADASTALTTSTTAPPAPQVLSDEGEITILGGPRTELTEEDMHQIELKQQLDYAAMIALLPSPTPSDWDMVYEET